MQKKLIALAVAGLVSAPAFAQSNVQIYGVMDLGFRHLSGGEVSVPGEAKPKSRSAIDHSGSSLSRLGFRGTEDLGNGLKAFFTIEQGLSPDTSSNPSSDRQAFVGLEGGFGKVWLGRDYNPSRAYFGSLDPFGLSGIGRAQDIFSQTDRYDNAVFYTTPNMSGFTVSVAYTGNVEGNEQTEFKGEPGDANTKGWSITPMYKNGPLRAGLGYESYSLANDGAIGDDDKQKRWQIGGGYDFGVVDLRLAYGQNKVDQKGGGDTKQKSWMLAAVAPVSEAGSVLASYTRTKIDAGAGSDAKASKFALGYLHSLSKRTAVYATYAKISTNDEAEGRFGLNGDRGTNTLSTDADETYRWARTSGFNIGIRHNF